MRIVGRVMLLSLLALQGCKVAGAIAYKVAGEPAVPAQYVPLAEPMLVLVENYRNPGEAYLSSERFTQHLIKQLNDHKIAPLVDQDEYYKLRDNKTSQLSKMSVAAIGKAVGAKQVLYVDLLSSSVNLATGSDAYKGQLAARVKVIDVETGTTRWPENAADGYPVSLETPVIRQREGITSDTVLDMTYRSAADQVTKLFYTWKPDE